MLLVEGHFGPGYPSCIEKAMLNFLGKDIRAGRACGYLAYIAESRRVLITSPDMGLLEKLLLEM